MFGKEKEAGARIVLVTGASSGFGHGVVKGLLERGGHIVYAASRRQEPMHDLRSAGAHLLEMDVSDSGSVRSGVERIVEERGRVDIVFNNAGYGVYGAVETVSESEAQRQFEVNLFGVAHVLREVLPVMRAAGSGRIINTSSAVAHMSIPVMGWYCASKFALRGLTDALRMELSQTGIEVVMIEPGVVRTGFREAAEAGLEGVEHPESYEGLVDRISCSMRKMFSSAPLPAGTVKVMLRAATSRRPKAVYRTTLDSTMTIFMRMVPSRIRDRMLLMRMR